MAGLSDNFEHLSHLFFVLKTVSDSVLKVTGLMSVVERFVSCHNREEHNGSLNNFIAETQSLLYLHPSSLRSEKEQFRDFHDFTLQCATLLGTILAAKRDNCRNCEKKWATDGKVFPVVIYSCQRGSYLGSRLTKHCHYCKLYEHHGNWSVNGTRKYDRDVLSLDFLLSSEDTAFEMSLLAQCGSLLFLGAVPFSTYTSSYNRRFNYNKQPTTDTGDTKVKRKKR